tara:strand:- start:4371 stop:4511 length:141 start_codon:yes stop_codon:yes gene_type:complete
MKMKKTLEKILIPTTFSLAAIITTDALIKTAETIYKITNYSKKKSY